MSNIKRKVRYVGPVERFNNKYGPLIPGTVVEIDADEYEMFIADKEFEAIEEMVAPPAPTTMVAESDVEVMVAELGEEFEKPKRKRKKEKKEE